MELQLAKISFLGALILTICLSVIPLRFAEQEQVVIALGPHHTLANDLIYGVFDSLHEQGYSYFDEIIIVGPNHFALGPRTLETSTLENEFFRNYNQLSQLIEEFTRTDLVAMYDPVFQGEHSIFTYLPLIKKNYPRAKITPLVFKGDFPEKDIVKVKDLITQEISQNSNKYLILFSVDFSHFQSPIMTEFHDLKNLGVLNSLDRDEAYELEVDCNACISLLLDLATQFDLRPSNLINKDSYDYLSYEPEEGGTSYISGLFSLQGEINDTRPLTLLAFGDLMLGRYVKDIINRYGQDEILSEIAGQEERFFEGMDFIFANLEGPVTDYHPITSKEIAFRFDPADLDILIDKKINLVSVANNHAYDMGIKGYADTRIHLDQSNITGFGDPKELNLNSFIEMKKSGYNLAFLALNDTDYKLNFDEANNLIKSLSDRNDFVLVSIHWGVEYSQVPLEKQRQEAREFVLSGADIIIGHHPHVVQGMELIDGVPVFYSLGNFVFDQLFSDETQQGMSFGLSFSKDKISIYLIPVGSDHARPYEMRGVQRMEMLKKFYDLSLQISEKNQQYQKDILNAKLVIH